MMTEATALKQRTSNIPTEMGNNMVMVDRKLLKNLISEIEDKLDELEAITDPEFMKEVSQRISDIENGDVEGLEEDKIFELLEG